MRYKCVSPCRLSYCIGSRMDEVDLKLAFRKLPEEELLRRIQELPANLRRKALEIHRAVWRKRKRNSRLFWKLTNLRFRADRTMP